MSYPLFRFFFFPAFKAPTNIISYIESIKKKNNLRGCDVSKKIVWIKWDSICLPVNLGGLGVQRLGEFISWEVMLEVVS